MFGHNDNNDNKKDDDQEEVVQPTTTAPIDDTSALGATDDSGSDDSGEPISVSTDSPTTTATVADDDSQEAEEDVAEEATTATLPTPSVGTDSPTPPADDDELLDIKREALQELSPLIGELDQAPEEKFRTTMMMIQASDNKSLVPTAFETAKQIQDDKKRAQALLDIVNEINYFTQNHEK